MACYRITEHICAKQEGGFVLCFYMHPKAVEDFNMEAEEKEAEEVSTSNSI
jgi:hypothetical protein